MTWCVVYTQAQGEFKAASNLLQQGFTVYLPKILKMRRHARRVDFRPVPLFPRYLFVHLDTERSLWRAINSTIGVVNLITHGVNPISIPADIIDEIMEREDDQGNVQIHKLSILKKGDPIRICLGTNAIVQGLFDGEDGTRVNVLLSLLGREVKTSVPAHAVSALS